MQGALEEVEELAGKIARRGKVGAWWNAKNDAEELEGAMGNVRTAMNDAQFGMQVQLVVSSEKLREDIKDLKDLLSDASLRGRLASRLNLDEKEVASLAEQAIRNQELILENQRSMDGKLDRLLAREGAAETRTVVNAPVLPTTGEHPCRMQLIMRYHVLRVVGRMQLTMHCQRGNMRESKSTHVQQRPAWERLEHRLVVRKSWVAPLNRGAGFGNAAVLSNWEAAVLELLLQLPKNGATAFEVLWVAQHHIDCPGIQCKEPLCVARVLNRLWHA